MIYIFQKHDNIIWGLGGHLAYTYLNCNPCMNVVTHNNVSMILMFVSY